jgi:hypothetical protein
MDMTSVTSPQQTDRRGSDEIPHPRRGQGVRLLVLGADPDAQELREQAVAAGYELAQRYSARVSHVAYGHGIDPRDTRYTKIRDAGLVLLPLQKCAQELGLAADAADAAIAAETADDAADAVDTAPSADATGTADVADAADAVEVIEAPDSVGVRTAEPEPDAAVEIAEAPAEDVAEEAAGDAEQDAEQDAEIPDTDAHEPWAAAEQEDPADPADFASLAIPPLYPVAPDTGPADVTAEDAAEAEAEAEAEADVTAEAEAEAEDAAEAGAEPVPFAEFSANGLVPGFGDGSLDLPFAAAVIGVDPWTGAELAVEPEAGTEGGFGTEIDEEALVEDEADIPFVDVHRAPTAGGPVADSAAEPPGAPSPSTIPAHHVAQHAAGHSAHHAANRSARHVLGSIVWALIPFVTFGLLTPVTFGYAAYRLRSRALVLSAVGYTAAVLALFVLSAARPHSVTPTDASGALLTLSLAATWIGGTLHAIKLRTRIFARTR